MRHWCSRACGGGAGRRKWACRGNRREPHDARRRTSARPPGRRIDCLAASKRTRAPVRQTPAALGLADALDQHIGGDASRPKRSEHSLADAAELRRLVADSGFDEINISTVTKTLRFPSVSDWVRIQLSGSPLATLLGGLDPARAEFLSSAIVADVEVALEAYSGPDGLAFPQQAHVLLAVA